MSSLHVPSLLLDWFSIAPHHSHRYCCANRRQARANSCRCVAAVGNGWRAAAVCCIACSQHCTMSARTRLSDEDRTNIPGRQRPGGGKREGETGRDPNSHLNLQRQRHRCTPGNLSYGILAAKHPSQATAHSCRHQVTTGDDQPAPCKCTASWARILTMGNVIGHGTVGIDSPCSG